MSETKTKVTLRNTSRQDVVVIDISKQIRLKPGEVKPGLELDDRTVRNLYRQMRSGSMLMVEFHDPSAAQRVMPPKDLLPKAESEPDPQLEPGPHSQTDCSGEGEGSGTGSGNEEPMTAVKLLAAADKMERQELQRQAKDLLGDGWPGGNPKKDDIIELLRTAALKETSSN